MSDGPQIRFLRHGGRRLAYEVRGEGPALIVPAWWVSHLELDWHDAAVREFWRAVGQGYTLIRYDRFGVGMSDRTLMSTDLCVEADAAVLVALLDELELDRVSVLGGSSGSCTAVAFAAAYPDRVQQLILYGSYAHGDALTPPGVGEAIIAAVQAHWGLGSRVLSDLFLGSADGVDHRRFARLQRESAQPETAAALLSMVYRLDVRSALSAVRAPTTVVHRRADRAVAYPLGREVAAAIAGSVLVPLQGDSHFPWRGDADSVVRAFRAALTSRTAVPDVVQPTHALSVREREILTLVACGLSDREIADHLSLSTHTVHRHVANIRHKLGSTSRTAAVAEAARVGLL